MSSHHHRDDPTTIPPTLDASHIQTVNTGKLDKVLDTTVLDAVLDFIITERGMKEYVAETMSLANYSLEYGKILERMTTTTDKVDGQSTLSAKLTVMWAIGFLAGASCAVKAVDEGLIVDEEDYEGGEYDGQD